jgi:hypothetical protein
MEQLYFEEDVAVTNNQGTDLMYRSGQYRGLAHFEADLRSHAIFRISVLRLNISH